MPFLPRKAVQKRSNSAVRRIVGGGIAAVVLAAVVLIAQSGRSGTPAAQSTASVSENKPPSMNTLPAAPFRPHHRRCVG